MDHLTDPVTARLALSACLDRCDGDLYRAAYHEAGHAVAAYHFKRRFDCVSIVSDWDRLGYIQGVARPSRTTANPAAIEEHMVYLLAGAAAVEMLLPIGWSGSLYEQVGAQLWARAAYKEPSERRACVGRAREQARLLVLRYRAAIREVVEALLERREIDSADARQLIVRAMRSHNEKARPSRHTVFRIED